MQSATDRFLKYRQAALAQQRIASGINAFEQEDRRIAERQEIELQERDQLQNERINYIIANDPQRETQQERTESLENEPPCESTANTKNAKQKNKSREWQHTEIVLLINLWSEEESLYNVKCSDYHDKDKKSNAIKRIKERLEEERVTVTSDEILHKLHSLRVYYSATRNRLEQSKRKSGSGTSDVFKVKLAYYGMLEFLSDNLKSRQTVTNLTRETNNSPDVSSLVNERNTIDSRNGNTNSKKKKSTNHTSTNSTDVSEENEFRRSALGYLNKVSTTSDTEDDYFCNMLASKLKKLKNSAKKEYLKLEIHQLIIKAEFDNSQNIISPTPRFNPSSYNDRSNSNSPFNVYQRPHMTTPELPCFQHDNSSILN